MYTQCICPSLPVVWLRTARIHFGRAVNVIRNLEGAILYVKFDDIKELLNSSPNTARSEIAVDLLRVVMARTLFSDESKSAIVSEFQRQLSSVA
jgi:hypothetical protein